MKGRFIEGAKIYLRPFKKSDIVKWHMWFNDPAVIYFMDKGRFPNTAKKQAEYLMRMNESDSDIQLAVIYKRNESLIGTIGLHQIDFISRNADISIILGDMRYWGKGIGGEAVRLLVRHAFDTLNLHKLTAGTIEENFASYRLFTALGFKKEGLLREHLYLHGRYHNVIKLGLTREGRS